MNLDPPVIRKILDHVHKLEARDSHDSTACPSNPCPTSVPRDPSASSRATASILILRQASFQAGGHLFIQGLSFIPPEIERNITRLLHYAGGSPQKRKQGSSRSGRQQSAVSDGAFYSYTSAYITYKTDV